MNELFLVLAPIAAAAITQLAKKLKQNPHHVLIAVSFLSGVLYWTYFLLPEQSQAWVIFAAGQVAIGSTGIYKVLLKYFPEMSRKPNEKN